VDGMLKLQSEDWSGVLGGEAQLCKIKIIVKGDWTVREQGRSRAGMP